MPPQSDENTTEAAMEPSPPRRAVAPWYEVKPLEDPDAIKCLQRGQKWLDAVDKSDFCATLDARSYPLFDPAELVLGPRLGLGGFGIVLEVEKIVLRHKPLSAIPSIETIQTEDETDEGYDDFDPEIMDHIDYSDVQQARYFMAHNVRRKHVTRLPNGKEIEGAARYAVKRLRSDLNDMHRARGAIDLAIEAKFLSRLSHPNIVKMRGYASGPFLRPDFFIVLDRLYEILSQRVKVWKHALQNHANEKLWKTLLLRKGKKEQKQNVVQDILLERLVIAYDLAAAFAYMHQNQLVYRDIKQENIGFDVRGDVKIFDFGLCKGLSASLKARDKTTGEELYGYKLTKLTGSLPYMAPEVFAGQPYDGKCDVYSFAILLWEMFTLKPAFRSIIQAEYKSRILEREERLPLQRRGDKIPSLMQAVIQESWQTDPKARPAMDRVARMIRGEMNLRCDNDDAIVRRTIHMNNRSRHSMRMGFNEEEEETPAIQVFEQHFIGLSLHGGLDA